MTARTTMLYPNEWRSLCVGTAQQLGGFFAQVPALTPESAAEVNEHIERLRMFVAAWSASAPPVQPQAEPDVPAAPEAAVLQGNGTAEPKRKGGWPKGRSRKPAAEAPGSVQ